MRQLAEGTQPTKQSPEVAKIKCQLEGRRTWLTQNRAAEAQKKIGYALNFLSLIQQIVTTEINEKEYCVIEINHLNNEILKQILPQGSEFPPDITAAINELLAKLNEANPNSTELVACFAELKSAIKQHQQAFGVTATPSASSDSNEEQPQPPEASARYPEPSTQQPLTTASTETNASAEAAINEGDKAAYLALITSMQKNLDGFTTSLKLLFGIFDKNKHQKKKQALQAVASKLSQGTYDDLITLKTEIVDAAKMARKSNFVSNLGKAFCCFGVFQTKSQQALAKDKTVGISTEDQDQLSPASR